MKKLKNALKGKLTKSELALLPASFDILGDILIFSDFPKELEKKKKLIGETLMKILKNVKVVSKKVNKYSGKFRTPKLRIMAGARRKETIHKENNVQLKLHAENVYFSPRLGNERKRIAQLVKPKEEILVMFSGCAPYPCVISKNSKTKEIIAIEINPIAHKYALENIRLNKLRNISAINGNVSKIIPKLGKKFDRILMPLPKEAEDYLELALSVSKKETIIHYYAFISEDETKNIRKKIKNAGLAAKRQLKILKMVKCGSFAPRTYRTCVDIKVGVRS